MQTKMYVVFQTHWDREWYFSLDRFNIRLLNVMEKIRSLLETETVPFFVLDGQVKVLEDYFQMINPSEQAFWRKMIETGRLIVGPWYVLSDEFLVSGESLVRNLEMGIIKANTLGKCQSIGYLPDTFGHVSQMPQILQGFGIDNAMVWRGVNSSTQRFNWIGADGTFVMGIFLQQGYYQPIFDQPDYATLFANYLNTSQSLPDGEPGLLTQGGDHLCPAEVPLQQRMSELADKHNIILTISDYETFVAAMRHKESPMSHVRGELRDNSHAYLLPNVLSSRYPIKKGQQKLEDWLIHRLEPLQAKAELVGENPHLDVVERFWERLLENHPHDSICGCSVDTVHREMMVRYEKLEESFLAYEEDLYARLGLRAITRHPDTNIFADDTAFSIYNPTPYSRNGYELYELFLHEDNPLNKGFAVDDGSCIRPVVVLNQSKDRRFASPLDAMPAFRAGNRYTIVFDAGAIDGYAFKAFNLVPQAFASSSVDTTSKTLEHDLYQIVIRSDGSLDLTHKPSGHCYEAVHRFEATLDAGDSYNYARPKIDQVSTPQLKQTRIMVTDDVTTVELHLNLVLPARLNAERQGPVNETVTNILKVTLTLCSGSPYIAVDTQIENYAEDMRLRCHFPLGSVIEHHMSDTAFDHVERTVRTEVFKTEKGKEVPPVVDPSLSLVHTDSGFVVHHRGLQEYQVYHDSDTSVVAMTMLRSIGYLSRDDFSSRGGGAGPSFEVPDAQLKGRHSFRTRFAFKHVPEPNESLLFRNPMFLVTGHTQYAGSLLTLDTSKLVASSCRWHNKALEFRLFNPSNAPQVPQFKSAFQQKKVDVIALDGKKLDVSLEDPVPPKTIRTYRFTLESVKPQSVDVLIAGGSIGGVLAAKTLAEAGRSVLLVEETDWIGGQLTNQAVPLDEHPFIESFGCTATYRTFRNAVRRYYAQHYMCQPHIDEDTLDPGNSWVTRLAFEPKVAHKLFEEMVSPFVNKNLEIRLRHSVVDAEVDATRVHTVTVQNHRTGEEQKVVAQWYLDATDTGSLLPLTATEHVTGAESQADTGERHAPIEADPYDMQPVTHVAALTWDESGQGLLEKPDTYEYFKSLELPYDAGFVLSNLGPDSTTKKARKFNIMSGRMPLWTYRRVFDPTQYVKPHRGELTLLNWPQNDYFMGNIFSDSEASMHKYMARELTRCFVYYLQHEMPREDGGKGYPNIALDKTALGTEDGLAMAPYIRESRRIKALHTIREQDVSAIDNPSLPKVQDSVGVGSYHIDLHITTRSHTFFYDNTWPFEIPLRALIPIKKKNLLPACKNIGTTHLTNGCFRLHPVEWNIGEVMGHLTDYLLEHQLDSHTFIDHPQHVQAFLRRLDEAGIERHWPEDKVHVI